MRGAWLGLAWLCAVWVRLIERVDVLFAVIPPNIFGSNPCSYIYIYTSYYYSCAIRLNKKVYIN